MIIKLFLVGIVVAIAYGFYNPTAIPEPTIQEKVLGIRDQLPQNDSLPGKVFSWIKEAATKTFIQFAENVKLPKQVTGLPEEIVVEDAVKLLTNKVKALPAEQAHKVKQNFCADIVAESTRTGEVAGTMESE